MNDLTVNFICHNGQLPNAINEIVIEFRDTASSELVDVGTVRFNLDMNMPGMAMIAARQLNQPAHLANTAAR